MSTDLVHVRVTEVDERSIRFVLTLVDPSGSMCLDEAFLLELFGLWNHSPPDVVAGPPVALAKLEKARRKIADREPEKVVASVEVHDVANYPAGHELRLEDFLERPREDWPRATYVVRFRFKDLLDFVAVGTEIASTAFDERNTGAMVLPGGVVQKRWPGELFSHAYGATRVGDLGLEVEVTSGAELPVPAPAAWLEIMRAPLRAIESDLPASYQPLTRAPRYLRSVELLHIEGARDARGSIYLVEGQVKAYGTVRTARYRVEISEARWLAGASFERRWALNAGYRGGSFMPDPAPSAAGDVETFEELVVLAREEGAAAELAMLEEGLRGSRGVVIAALGQSGALGSRAASLVPLVAERIGALDADVVCAASAAAASIAAPQLASWLALASLRCRSSDTDRRAADAAAAALATLANRPAWCDAFVAR